ncbi:MAG: hypothetical protein KQI35_02775 [Bacteroidetes bacterium]|nr:hypothetical protein [Bacteroidota bacterium]
MIQKLIYIFFLLVLSVPAVQYFAPFTTLKPLDGAYTLEEQPELTWKTWYSGEFQEKYVIHLEDHVGFREWIIRLYNQLNYSLFNLAESPGCVVGKNGQLFLRSYIEEYMGMEFMGQPYIDQKVGKIKFIHDYLALYGKTFFLVFAPGKASFFPEYIPREYTIKPFSLNNHDYYVQRCSDLDVPFIDMNSWFSKIKNNSPYDLYPLNGVHWTDYGMYLGMDSLIHYIESKRNLDLPELVLEDVIVSDSIAPPNNDVEVNMNLIWEIKKPPVPYPVLAFKEPKNDTPRLLVISDSYFWQAYEAQIPQHLFNFSGFWFYSKTAYNDQYEQGISVDSLNFRSEVMAQDVIFIMGTEATMHMFPFGFADQLYESLVPKNQTFLVKLYEEKIRKSEDWMASTREKAIENGQTLNERITIEALYMAELDQQNLSEDEIKLNHTIEEIRKEPELMNALQYRSQMNQLDLDALILYEAEKRCQARI